MKPTPCSALLASVLLFGCLHEHPDFSADAASGAPHDRVFVAARDVLTKYFDITLENRQKGLIECVSYTSANYFRKSRTRVICSIAEIGDANPRVECNVRVFDEMDFSDPPAASNRIIHGRGKYSHDWRTLDENNLLAAKLENEIRYTLNPEARHPFESRWLNDPRVREKTVPDISRPEKNADKIMDRLDGMTAPDGRIDFEDEESSSAEPPVVKLANPVKKNPVATEAYRAEVHRGLEQFRRADYRAARKFLENAAAMQPELPLAHLFLGHAYTALNHYGPAVMHIRQAMDAFPKWAAVPFNWETIYRDEAEFMLQFDLLRQYAETNPENLDTKFLLGYTYYFNGEFDEALPLFTQVVEKNPDDKYAQIFINAIRAKRSDT